MVELLRSEMLLILEEVALYRVRSGGGYPDVVSDEAEGYVITASADENGRPSLEVETWDQVQACFEAAERALPPLHLNTLASLIEQYHQATTEDDRRRIQAEAPRLMDEFLEHYYNEEPAPA